MLFFAFQLKHLLVDFFFQTDRQVKTKGIYGNITGLTHSMEHAVLTFAICCGFSHDVLISGAAALIDLVLHYHIDWAKMRFGDRDVTKPKFWQQLGLDQFAHQVTYIIIVLLIFSTKY